MKKIDNYNIQLFTDKQTIINGLFGLIQTLIIVSVVYYIVDTSNKDN